MPVTAKLSRKFYERLGDDIANELVEWFNLVDETYKAQLRELNELNFARFDAKVEERFAQSDSRISERFAQSDARMTERFLQMDAKFEERLTRSETKFEERLTRSETKMEERLAKSEAKMGERMAKLEDRIGKFEVAIVGKLAAAGSMTESKFTGQIRWMVGPWIVQITAMVTLLLQVLRTQ